MSPKDARRVARYHGRNPGCLAFTERQVGVYGAAIWRGHFESDLRALNEPPDKRSPVDGEEARIVTFLTDGLKVTYA